MIDIIIPVYNAHETIRKTLLSVAFQSISNKIKVTLVDNYSDKDYNYLKEEFFGRVDLEILRIDKKTSNGLVKKYGLDNTENKYIVFLDSNDIFYTYDSLESLYNEIKHGYDYVDSLTLYHKENAQRYGEIHGKIYRRSFIDKKNIRFNDTKYYEDNVFNSLVLVNNPRINHLDVVTYIIRGDINLSKKLDVYIDNINYVIEEAKKMNCKKELILQYVYSEYFFLANQYENISSSNKEKLKKRLNKYDFSIYLNMLNQEQLREIAPIL